MKHAAQTQVQKALLQWYRANARPLPWRENRDAYRIWISETMLQQTTVTAVIPYYARFLQTFDSLEKLAIAPIERVLGLWSGLGYYSRARNLHKAALEIAKLGAFPRTHGELLQLPGFGPYTARAVSSLAFGENVGVLDGNVIRLLTRYHGLDVQWWKPAVRNELQQLSDSWVKNQPAHEVNQALMELGATICTPRSPTCLLCPLASSCRSYRDGKVELRPLPKPRRAREIWVWKPLLVHSKKGIAFVRNSSLPFFKGQWLLPGSARLENKKPKKFDYRHSITHHDIFVKLKPARVKDLCGQEVRWIPEDKVSGEIPASLISKALQKNLSAKLSFVALILLSGFFLGIAGCKSAPTKPEAKGIVPLPVKPPEGLDLPSSEALTEVGDNFRARFSPDGQRILYVSRSRPSHGQAQIYEMSLKTKEEKRVTFQYGDATAPAYHPDGKHAIYASSNDEIKEDPWFLSGAQRRFGGTPKELEKAPDWDWFPGTYPTELYSSFLDGHDLERITRNPGFDSEPVYHPKGNSVAYVSNRSESSQIVLATPRGELIRYLSQTPRRHRQPAWHPKGQNLVWVVLSADGETSDLLLVRGNESKSDPLQLPQGLHLYPAFNSDGKWIVFSSNMDDKANFELYAARPEDGCMIRLTYTTDAEYAPSVSPNGQSLIYTSNAKGGVQIYQRALELPVSCPATATQLPLNEKAGGTP